MDNENLREQYYDWHWKLDDYPSAQMTANWWLTHIAEHNDKKMAEYYDPATGEKKDWLKAFTEQFTVNDGKKQVIHGDFISVVSFIRSLLASVEEMVRREAYHEGYEQGIYLRNDDYENVKFGALLKVATQLEKTFNGCACGSHGYMVLPDCDKENHGEKCARCILLSIKNSSK